MKQREVGSEKKWKMEAIHNFRCGVVHVAANLDYW